MWILALIPFAAQAIAIAIDEGYFHYKRGLPLWERIGHPLDTLSMLFCLGFVIYAPFSTNNLVIYACLAVFSCLMVTKDEFVHKHHCPGAENWLHALLFILHPITLITAGIIWPVTQGVEIPSWLGKWLDNPSALHEFLYIQFWAIFLFCAYQAFFWNVVWRNKPVIKQ